MGKKITGRAFAMPGGIAIGILAAVITTLLGAVLLTGMVAGERMTVETIGYAVMVITFFASLIGAVIAMITVKHRKMQVCLLTGAGYYLVLLASNAMFFGGQYDGAVLTGVIALGASAIAAIVGSREGKAGKRRRKIPAYR